MSKIIKFNQKLKDFNKEINIPGDKSLSIRWVLFSSLAEGHRKLKIYYCLKMFAQP